MSEPTIRIRVIAPDLWRERKMEFELTTSVGYIKRTALPELLLKEEVDPAAFYVEYFEKEVLDEGQTLADLGITAGGVLSIRQYDVDHPPPFEG
ncbi:MAG: hypothetical protein JSU87_02140 [Gemmatimonadota bacterium]|nr:MAG: hypothetical protein JSU87_02140 [Gemmatimonadota bacterium]